MIVNVLACSLVSINHNYMFLFSRSIRKGAQQATLSPSSFFCEWDNSDWECNHQNITTNE
jgi:hypothetical protein